MDQRSQDNEEKDYTANLDYTLKELQRNVKQHEDELQRLRERDSTVIQTPAAQAKVVKTALEDVTNAEPFLPLPSSILPALLALRRTHQTIQESKKYLESQETVVDHERRQLEADQANLRDQNLLTEALSTRIDALQEELATSADLQPDDGARRRREEIQKKKTNYDKDSRRIFRALNDFIDQHLAAMLAAEELGGPVVGDMMEIDTEDLASGFSSQGRLKKTKGGPNEDKRQRRIDEIWGQGTGTGGGAAEGQGIDEVAAAGREMKQLTSALLQQLQEAKGDNSASYVTLGRESAAARFLVRSKVAQFHPKDASRLRLIDFGRELEA